LSQELAETVVETEEPGDKSQEIQQKLQELSMDEKTDDDILYDPTIVTILDILNFLLQLSPKEVISKFIMDREVSLELSKQFFLCDNEGIRL